MIDITFPTISLLMPCDRMEMWRAPKSRRASWSSCSGLIRLCAQLAGKQPKLEGRLLTMAYPSIQTKTSPQA